MKLLLTAGVGNFLVLFLPVLYGTGVGPGLVHLPEEFKVSEAWRNTMTWIKQPKCEEGYFCRIEEAVKLLLKEFSFLCLHTHDRPPSSMPDQKLLLTIQDTPKAWRHMAGK